jgi:transcription elongation factor GreA
MSDDIILTLEAKLELEQELLHRTTEGRKEVADELERSRQEGDLSENSAHDEAIQKRDHNELRIKEIEQMLRNAVIIEENENSVKIGMGKSFEVEIEVAGNSSKILKTFTIVPATQANPLEGKISMESPLGVALLGHKQGDKINFTQPDGKEATYFIKNLL